MKTVKIKRLRKLVGGAVPIWIVTKMTKKEFLVNLNVSDTLVKSYTKQPDRVFDFKTLDNYGTRISSGKEITLTLGDDHNTIFAVTHYATFSEELRLEEENKEYMIEISAKGGWSTPGYPVLTFK